MEIPEEEDTMMMKMILEDEIDSNAPDQLQYQFNMPNDPLKELRKLAFEGVAPQVHRGDIYA